MKNQLLKVDLTRRACEIEEIPDKVLRNFLGGRGLGSYLLYRSVPAKADPLGAENHIIFTAGPASGTNLFFSAKVNVTTKSPLTGIYLYSISSGSFAHQMRKAGFWAIDISGTAESPVYLRINNGEVEFRDAASLWGTETGEAQQVMNGGLSQREAATLTIGPAGERLIKYAAIMSEGDLYRAFGRGGAGCVMGAKKLKGIVVSGDHKIEAGDREKYEEVRKVITANLAELKAFSEDRRNYGTAGNTRRNSQQGFLPTRNWQQGQFEGVDKLDAKANAAEWPRKSIVCGPFCPSPCSHYIELEKGPYRGAHTCGPEYETLYSLGANCGIDKYDALVAADQICDQSGLDSMSAGVAIGFAMECFERGLIGLEDTDGIELRFGNDKAMITMLKKIVDREGFGNRLAEGVRKLSEEIKGSTDFAMHAKGMELGGYECRGLTGQALQYAISSIGGSHHAYGLPALTEIGEGTRLNIEGKGEQVKNLATGRIIADSVPFCSFLRAVFNMPTVAKVISALRGEPWTVEDIEKVGYRVQCQERLFNMREGLTRQDDILPPRLLNEPKPDGPTQGAVVPLEELKDDYYRAMNWDLATGNPTDTLLAGLEIKP